MSNGDKVVKDVNEHTRAARIVGTTVVIAFIFLGLGVWVSQWFKEPMRLPFLVIAGLLALLGVLAAMAIAFKAVHLANQTQALGLPDGTIRAVMALSLILIFAAVTVYLFSELSDTGIECSDVAALRDDFAKQLEKYAPLKPPPPQELKKTAVPTQVADPRALLAAIQITPNGAAPKPVTPPIVPPPTPDPKTAVPPDPKATPLDNPIDKTAPPPGEEARRTAKAAAAQDFAKQLLIMLGTLITSITSFYFGSKTATDSQTGKPAPSSPKLMSVEPKEIPSTDATTVKGTGSSLLLADTVTLRNAEGTTVGTKDVSSSETTVQFTVPSGTGKGRWDVVVKSRDGGEGILSSAIAVS